MTVIPHITFKFITLYFVIIYNEVMRGSLRGIMPWWALVLSSSFSCVSSVLHSVMIINVMQKH